MSRDDPCRSGRYLFKVGNHEHQSFAPSFEAIALLLVVGIAIVSFCDARLDVVKDHFDYQSRDPHSSYMACYGSSAVATERLSLLADGHVLYRLKHPWRDGSTHVQFEPLELVEKVAS